MRTFAALLLLTAPSLFADGGTVQLRKEVGPYLITVFTAPEDISVLIQNRTSLQPILDADVLIRIGETQLHATHQAAQNKLLYAAPLAAEEPGKLDFTIDVNHGSIVSGTLNIAQPAPMLASNWEYLALPPVFILLFAVREWLVRRRAILVR
ncbi:MAG TPA: hypothetical protein VEU96_30015 [Bryobacteraceae bacterium]|nr:hypothetical protein [Bryobacteraceae bacterium]